MFSPLSIPFRKCPYCDENEGVNLYLPFECPLEIREEVEAVRRHDPVLTVNKWNQYLKRWEAYYEKEKELRSLVPGAHFQPLHWVIPTRPRADFFWGIHMTIVSEKVYQLFQSHHVSSADFFPVTIDRVGDREPTEPFPDEGWYTEEELRQVIPPIEDPRSTGTFYHAIIKVDGAREQDDLYMRKVTVPCAHCGQQQFSIDKDDEIRMRNIHSDWKKQRIFPRRFIPEVAIFRSHVYSGLIIKSHVYELIKDSDFSTCDVRELIIKDV